MLSKHRWDTVKGLGIKFQMNTAINRMKQSQIWDNSNRMTISVKNIKVRLQRELNPMSFMTLKIQKKNFMTIHLSKFLKNKILHNSNRSKISFAIKISSLNMQKRKMIILILWENFYSKKSVPINSSKWHLGLSRELNRLNP